ncbi:MAG TPA: hypothetical protein VFO82_07835, partial [Steroidobacteraceae bacterium]|nr:hypothetical protein [Steroidobacteraceae bacterium]
GDLCDAVIVPPNAYLSSRGDAWQCERGFRSNGSRCIELAPPLNAQIDYSGNDWRCEDGFRKVTQSCVADQ